MPTLAQYLMMNPSYGLSQENLKTGMSTAPVAQGEYAWMDGLARALQGVAGGYVDNKQRAAYAKDEADLLATAKARGETGLAGMAPQIASTLASTQPGASTAPTPPQPVIAGMPVSPPPVPGAAVSAPPAQGVALANPFPQGGRAPSSGSAPRTPIPFGQTQDGGIPMEAMPNTPEAEAAVQSGRLRTAYQMLAGGNRYEYARAQDMLDKGLADQTNADESAAARRQSLKDMGYQAGLQRYGADRSQVRDANTAADAQAREQQFTLTRDERQNAFDLKKLGIAHGQAVAIARLNNDAQWRQTMAQIKASQASAEDKVAARRAMFFSTPTGSRLWTETTDKVDKNSAFADKLTQFEELGKKTQTGTAMLRTPGAREAMVWKNRNLQTMEALEKDIGIAMQDLMKGAVSDAEGRNIAKSTVTIQNRNDANTAVANIARRLVRRNNDMVTSRLDAVAGGPEAQVAFARDWDAYRNSVSLDKDVDFSTWKATRPQFDASGKRTN
jgi:hypothetical protein